MIPSLRRGFSNHISTEANIERAKDNAKRNRDPSRNKMQRAPSYGGNRPRPSLAPSNRTATNPTPALKSALKKHPPVDGQPTKRFGVGWGKNEPIDFFQHERPIRVGEDSGRATEFDIKRLMRRNPSFSPSRPPQPQLRRTASLEDVRRPSVRPMPQGRPTLQPRQMASQPRPISQPDPTFDNSEVQPDQRILKRRNSIDLRASQLGGANPPQHSNDPRYANAPRYPHQSNSASGPRMDIQQRPMSEYGSRPSSYYEPGFAPRRSDSINERRDHGPLRRETTGREPYRQEPYRQEPGTSDNIGRRPVNPQPRPPSDYPPQAESSYRYPAYESDYAPRPPRPATDSKSMRREQEPMRREDVDPRPLPRLGERAPYGSQPPRVAYPPYDGPARASSVSSRSPTSMRPQSRTDNFVPPPRRNPNVQGYGPNYAPNYAPNYPPSYGPSYDR